jgi:RNA polymerase sigma-70 factor (ECF subfamily)
MEAGMTSTDSHTDADLVARCRRGDDRAWRELVERFSRYVYAIVTRGYGLKDADAEDTFQDVFTRAFERLDTLDDPSALRPWLAQLTRRLAVDRLRARRDRQESGAELDLPDPRDVIAELDEALTVHQALRGLPDNCRELLDGFFARDQSYRVLSEALGLPQGTIASRISRCLERLGTELRKIGHPIFV